MKIDSVLVHLFQPWPALFISRDRIKLMTSQSTLEPSFLALLRSHPDLQTTVVATATMFRAFNT